MKKLITADEVREGDLVRLEFDGEKAVEGRAGVNKYSGRLLVGEFWVGSPSATEIYLLDRPAPPKIPADAEYVTWANQYGRLRIAHKMNDGKWGVGSGRIALKDLLKVIGDAEVTVLVPKEGQA